MSKAAVSAAFWKLSKESRPESQPELESLGHSYNRNPIGTPIDPFKEPYRRDPVQPRLIEMLGENIDPLSRIARM